MIQEDLRTELLSDATISGIVGNRIYSRHPNESQAGSYITMRISERGRNKVREEYTMRILTFAKTMSELATLSDRIIVFLEDKKELNNNEYYKIWFVNQIEEPVKLDDGFYFNMLDFIFSKTT